MRKMKLTHKCTEKAANKQRAKKQWNMNSPNAKVAELIKKAQQALQSKFLILAIKAIVYI